MLEDRDPRTLNHRYRLDELLGEGGMGVVYRAADLLRDGRPVAVKLLHAERSRPSARTRLQNEFNALARLRHPNLVSVFDLGVDQETGRWFLTMEFVSGPTLCGWQFSTPAALLDVVVPLCHALDFIHARGFIHADIKPDNVLMDQDGTRPRIADFGLSAMLAAPGKLRGTLPYTAPEVLKGSPPGHASDLYALGVTLYEVAAGHPPFDGSRPEEVIAGHLNREPTFPNEMVARLPPGLALLLKRLLAKDPADRPVSGAAVVRSINDLVGSSFPADSQATGEHILLHVPLHGRDDELNQIDTTLAGLLGERHGSRLFITGPEGIGKSRLVEELRIRAQMAGLTVLVARCTPDDDPFHALGPLLRDLAALTSIAMPDALAPIVENGAGAVPSTRGQDELLDAMAEWIGTATGTLPLVLVFEDLHLAGPDLLDILLYLTRSLQDDAVVLTLTARLDSPSRQLAGIVEEIEHQSDVVSLVLAPLDADAAGDLVAALLGGAAPDTGLLTFVVQRAGGNPLLVAEMLLAYRQSGAIEQDADGEWRLHPDLAGRQRLAGNLGDAALERIERLPGPEKRILAWLAVSYTARDAASLGRLLGQPAERVARSLERLAHVDLLTELDGDESGPTYRFTHVFVRDALYHHFQSRDPGACRTMHAALADSLDRGEDTPARCLGDLAGHLEAAGRSESAAAMFMRAAAAAHDRHALGAAARHYEQAVELLSPGDGRAPHLPRAWEGLADLHRLSGRPLDAAEAYAKALASLPAGGPVSERAELLRKRSNALNYGGRFDAAVEAAVEAREMFEAAGSPAGVADCLNSMGVSCARQGDHAGAERHYRQALEMRRGLDDPARTSGSLANLAMVIFFQGRHQEGRQLLDQALEASRRAGDQPGVARVYNNLGLLATDEGRMDEARAFLEKAETTYRELRAIRLRAECLVNLANLTLATGHYHDAVTSGTGAAHVYRRLGMHAALANAQQITGDAQRECGRVDAAIESHERALANARRSGSAVQEAFCQHALALDHASAGNASAARAILDRAPDRAFTRTDARLVRWADRVRAMTELAEGRHAKALQRLEQLLDSGQDGSDVRERIELLLACARAQMAGGDFTSALTSLQSAGEVMDSSGIVALRWVRLRLRSQCLEATRRPEEARTIRGEAVDALAALAAQLPEEYRTALMNTPAATRLRIDAGGSAHARVAPTRFLDTMYEAIEALISSRDQETVARKVLDLALGVLGAERGLVLLFREPGGAPIVAAARDLDEATTTDAVNYSYRVVETGRVGRSLVASDARNDPALSEFKSISRYGIQSVICVPMRSHQRVLGTVYLDSRVRTIGFDDDDLGFLEALAQHAATALDNIRMMRALQRENLTLRQALMNRYAFGNIVGGSPAMKEVFATLRTVSASSLPVLITGESGTGKELVAHALHYNGPRKDASFLSENCAAFSDTLLESELFGHARGAFTGAAGEKQGLLQEANGGTLFLDEVGDMSPALQSRLTRVLETGEVRPVGATYTVRVDVRIIAATHRNIEQMADEGRFRRDLLFRLNVIPIHLPPLRDRRDDIPLLVSHFLPTLAAEMGRQPPGIEEDALEILTAHDWPGNVRQLRNEISRLLVFGAGDVITADEVRALDATPPAPGPAYEESTGPIIPLKELERRHIIRALQETRGDRTRAAQILRVGRATVFRKIRDYDLDI
ncbi:MAG: sigma 54-interacting transcriptional regulator [Acidobacteriota bacterium]